jgi:ribosomal protein S18 acetylase RimI-like enzyme
LDRSRAAIRQLYGLTEAERAAAEQLKALADRLEALDLPLNLAQEGTPAARDTRQFLYVEGGTPLGFLSADFWPEPEVCLVVHPDQRRRGIGRALLAAAAEDARGRGASVLLLVAEDASTSGRAFVAAQGAMYRSSEYRMRLDVARVPEVRPIGPIRLRRATLADTASIGDVVGAAFGDPAERHRRRAERELGDPTIRYYLGELDRVPIGSLRLIRVDGRTYVTAFGVLPRVQGRGYGRQILSATIRDLLAEEEGEIYIEVETTNQGAIGLYRSCGFEVTSAFGYYALTLGK